MPKKFGQDEGWKGINPRHRGMHYGIGTQGRGGKCGKTPQKQDYQACPHFIFPSLQLLTNASNIVGWMHVSCFGHSLDLAISKSLKLDQVNRALARCHSPVELFHFSWLKNCDLRLKQELLNLPQHNAPVNSTPLPHPRAI